jgi:hypothetical protein
MTSNDLDPIDGHPFTPDPNDLEACGHVSEEEGFCGWPEADHVASERPGYQPDEAYHQALRNASSGNIDRVLAYQLAIKRARRLHKMNVRNRPGDSHERP